MIKLYYSLVETWRGAKFQCKGHCKIEMKKKGIKVKNRLKGCHYGKGLIRCRTCECIFPPEMQTGDDVYCFCCNRKLQFRADTFKNRDEIVARY